MNKSRLWSAVFFLLCSACSRTPGGAEGYKVVFVPATAGQSGIISVNSDTTGSQVLITDKKAEVRFASWSPDGKKLAFYTLRDQDRDLVNKYGLLDESLLYIMDATGKNPKRLLDFPIMDFGWAPDSRHLFFISAHEGPDRLSVEVLSRNIRPLAYVYVLDTQTGAVNRLPGAGRNCSAAWSPDGTRIAVSFGLGEDCGIHLVSPDGKTNEKLTDGKTIDFRPAWSPDGKSIAYVAYSDSDEDAANSGIFVISSDGTGKRRVDHRTASYVLWSLDGRNLLLQSGATALLIDPNGQKQVNLAAAAGFQNIVNAIFTPDGKSIMFTSKDSGISRIYLISMDGQKRKTITTKTSSSNFCLSPLLTRQ